MPTSSMPTRLPICCARMAPPCASRSLRAAPELLVFCTLSSEPPARISEAICDCGMAGSEKNVMRGSRSVPRTFTPAVMSGNTFCARRSMPGSPIGPLLKISRPRSMSSCRPSAAYLPSDDVQFALAAADLRFIGAHGDAAAQPRGEAERIDVAPHRPAPARMLLTTIQRCAGSTGGAPTSTSSLEASTALVRSAGSRLRVGHAHFAVGLDASAVELEIKLRRRIDARFGNIHHAQVLAFDMQRAVGFAILQASLPLNLAWPSPTAIWPEISSASASKRGIQRQCRAARDSPGTRRSACRAAAACRRW